MDAALGHAFPGGPVIDQRLAGEVYGLGRPGAGLDLQAEAARKADLVLLFAVFDGPGGPGESVRGKAAAPVRDVEAPGFVVDERLRLEGEPPAPDPDTARDREPGHVLVVSDGVGRDLRLAAVPAAVVRDLDGALQVVEPVVAEIEPVGPEVGPDLSILVLAVLDPFLAVDLLRPGRLVLRGRSRRPPDDETEGERGEQDEEGGGNAAPDGFHRKSVASAHGYRQTLRSSMDRLTRRSPMYSERRSE